MKKFSEKEYLALVDAYNREIDQAKRRKLLVVKCRMEKMSGKQIQAATGFKQSRIYQIISDYCEHGLGFVARQKKQNGNQNLSYGQEKALLSEFDTLHTAGVEISVKDIRARYDQMIGHNSSQKTIYDLMKRHNWVPPHKRIKTERI